MIAQRFGFTGDFSRERDSRPIVEREKSPVESKIKRGRAANGKSGFNQPVVHAMNDGEERFEADFRISDAVDSFYTRWNALSQPYFAWQFEQFAPYLGRRVADVGCGPANLTPFCLDRDLYLGADLDPAMTGRVTRRFGSHPSVHTYTGNVLEPAFPEEMKRLGIDTVVCLNFLAHVVDERRALANMIDPLPEGGRLCLLVPAHPAIKGDLEKIDGMLRRYTRAMLHERFETLPVTVLKSVFVDRQ